MEYGSEITTFPFFSRNQKEKRVPKYNRVTLLGGWWWAAIVECNSWSRFNFDRKYVVFRIAVNYSVVYYLSMALVTSVAVSL